MLLVCSILRINSIVIPFQEDNDDNNDDDNEYKKCMMEIGAAKNQKKK